MAQVCTSVAAIHVEACVFFSSLFSISFWASLSDHTPKGMHGTWPLVLARSTGSTEEPRHCIELVRTEEGQTLCTTFLLVQAITLLFFFFFFFFFLLF